MRDTLMSAALVLGVLMAPSPAAAQEAEGCGDVVEVDRFHYLRQLTLDLWGRVPTEAELKALVDAEDVPAETIAAMVDGPEMRQGLVARYHSDLMWPNVDAGDLVNPALAFLLPAYYYELELGFDFEGADRLFLLYVGLFQRGGLVPCKNEPAEFDADGEPILEEMDDGTRREGWVLIEPYWAPGTQVKVCALEARTVLTSATYQVPCSTATGMYSGECGCGAQLERCVDPSGAEVIRQSFQSQLLRMAERPLTEGRAYFDMLTDVDEELNGPLIHYYRHLAPMAVEPWVQVPPVALQALPSDVPFTDLSWKAYRRGPEHSGVLTSMLYLLRFQTARARANQFYSAFLCAPFQAPDVELPSPNEACSQEPDLRKRCGCNYCHTSLDPAAAHWAKFVEAGTQYMDAQTFPEQLARCANCGANCDYMCQRFYVTEAAVPEEEPYVGMLRALLYRDDAEQLKMFGGPKALVRETLESQALPNCTISRLFERLHGREMSDTEVLETLPQLRDVFERAGWTLPALLEALVTLPSYRRLAR